MIDSSMKTSFGKFKGKHIGTHHAGMKSCDCHVIKWWLDFSDNVGRPLQFGFKVDPEDYEMVLLITININFINIIVCGSTTRRNNYATLSSTETRGSWFNNWYWSTKGN